VGGDGVDEEIGWKCKGNGSRDFETSAKRCPRRRLLMVELVSAKKWQCEVVEDVQDFPHSLELGDECNNDYK
jgi:hypothetical protein